jgi:hypothetical protein
MASGRPRQPNDPSVVASLESALRNVARPGIFGLIWNWRYELGLTAGLAAVTLASGYALGAAWLIAFGAIGLALMAAGLAWAPSRRRLIARAWCVITPHRVRVGCINAWVQTRRGKLPFILHTVPTDHGERVYLWCRAGITAADLFAARHLLAAACWAKEVWVVPSARYAHLVTLEVVRKQYSERTGPTPDAWPYSRYLDGDPGDDSEDRDSSLSWWKPAV